MILSGDSAIDDIVDAKEMLAAIIVKMIIDIPKELEEPIIKVIREKCNSIFDNPDEEMNKRNKAASLLIQITSLEKEQKEYEEWLKNNTFEIKSNSEPVPRLIEFQPIVDRMSNETKRKILLGADIKFFVKDNKDILEKPISGHEEEH